MAFPLTQPMRERILDAAVALLRSEGPAKLSQTYVARAAGVRQSHLTYYYPKKTDLLIAVARRSVEVMARELTEFFAGEGWRGADDDLRERVMRLLGFVVKDRSRTRLVLGLLLASDEDPELRKVLVEQISQARALLARGMGRAVDDREVDLTMATFWGVAVQHLLFEGVRDDAVTDELIRRVPIRGRKPEPGDA